MKRHRFWIPARASVALAATAGLALANFETFLGYRIIAVKANGSPVQGQVPAILVEGNTMLPLRAVAEALGVEVGWDPETYTVSLTGGGKQPIATVNGQAITKDMLYQRLAEQGGEQVLDTLVTETLIDQEARKANITISPAAVDAELQTVKRRLGGEEKFQAALRQYNLTESRFREQLRRNLVVRQILAPKVAQMMTAERVSTHFARYEARIRFPDLQVRARHILVRTEADAMAVLQRLSQGETFEAIAAQVSLDPGSRDKGGDLGYFGPDVMVAEFEKAAFALSVGQRSGPVQSPFGYHIIEILDRKEQTRLSIDEGILVARNELLDSFINQIRPDWLKSLRDSATVTRTPDGATR